MNPHFNRLLLNKTFSILSGIIFFVWFCWSMSTTVDLHIKPRCEFGISVNRKQMLILHTLSTFSFALTTKIGGIQSWLKVTKFLSLFLYLYWWWESEAAAKVFSSTSPKLLRAVNIWTLWWPVHVWKWCLMLPEPLSHSLSLMNRGIVILEFTRVIREEKNPLIEKPAHSVYSGCQLTCFFFWAHSDTEPRPDPQKNCYQYQHWQKHTG